MGPTMAGFAQICPETHTVWTTEFALKGKTPRGFPLKKRKPPDSEGAKEILVCQDPKKFQGGDADADYADADADGSTDRHEG